MNERKRESGEVERKSIDDLRYKICFAAVKHCPSVLNSWSRGVETWRWCYCEWENAFPLDFHYTVLQLSNTSEAWAAIIEVIFMEGYYISKRLYRGTVVVYASYSSSNGIAHYNGPGPNLSIRMELTPLVSNSKIMHLRNSFQI